MSRASSSSYGRRDDHHRPSAAHHFSLSDADFERDAVLKRRRYLSPPKSPPTETAATSSIAMRVRARSKSKSRGRTLSTLRRLPSVEGQEFYALGRSSTARPSNGSASASVAASTAAKRARSPSTTRGHQIDRGPSVARATAPARQEREERGRSVSKARSKSKARDDSRRSKSTSRRRRRSRSRSRSRSHRSSSSSSSSSDSSPDRRRRRRSKSVTTRRSKSKSKAKAESVSAPSTSSSDDRELQADMERTERKLRLAKKDLEGLEVEMAALQKRVDAKKYEVMDLQIVLDGLQKRKALAQQFMRSDGTLPSQPSTTSYRSSKEPSAPTTTTASSSSSRPSSARPSKRPCIVDEEEEEEDDDDDVVFVDAPDVKMEIVQPSKESSRRSSGASRRVSPVDAAAAAPPTSSSSNTRTNGSSRSTDAKAANPQMSDYFWGRVDIAKLLVQPRIRHIPDGSARKGRHLAFNPIQQDVFATSSDDGGLILWNYARQNHEVTKVVSFAPTSFRQEAQCPEGIAWSPDGERLAIAFRDPLANMSEFCVVRLHQLTLTDSQRPQVLPRDRVKSKTTTHHSRGISAIEWIPTGHGDRQSARGLITAGSDHRVVMWEEHESSKSNHSDFKSRVLHEEHRSDVRAICMHSERKAIYTGGLDGLVVRYDMHAHKATVVMERRRPQISKINAVLENPHNPNLLLVSSVEQAEHNLLLHDLREKYDSRRSSTMTLTWMRSSDAKSMSQYIVPRWSPGGFHVSCGSTTGLVNIWDVRVRSPQFPIVLPQQSISMHQKQVLHATWHPRYDAMFSVSHDRNLGLLTFR